MPLAPQAFTSLHHFPYPGYANDTYYPSPFPRELLPTNRDAWTASYAQVVEFLWLAREFTYDWSFEFEYTLDAGTPDHLRKHYIGSGSHTTVMIPSAPHERMTDWGYINHDFDTPGLITETLYDGAGAVIGGSVPAYTPYMDWSRSYSDPEAYVGPTPETLSLPFNYGIYLSMVQTYRGTISDYLADFPTSGPYIIGQFSRSFMAQSFPLVLSFSPGLFTLDGLERITGVSATWEQSMTLGDSWSFPAT